MGKNFITNSKHNKHKSVFVLSLILMVALSSLSLMVVAQAVDFSDCNLWCRIKYLFTGDITGGAALITGAAVAEWTQGTTGLVSYWTMDNADIVGGECTDSHTGGNDLTISGVETGVVNGILGEAYNSSGDPNYVYQNSPVSTVTDNFAMSLWFWAPADGASGNIMSNGWGSGGYGMYFYTGPNFHWGLYSGVGWLQPDDTIVTDEQWNHLVITRRSGTSYLYVNGVESAYTYTLTPKTPTDIFKIGDLADGAEGYFDEIGFWDRSLSATEVEALYNNGDGLAYPFEAAPEPEAGWPEGKTGLVSYWTMDDADIVGGECTDSHTGGNDGTITGNVTTGQTGATPALGEAYLMNGDGLVTLSDTSIVGTGAGIDWSVSFWFNYTSFAQYDCMFRMGAHSSTQMIAIGLSDATHFYIDNFGGPSYPIFALSSGTWYHVVFTSDGSNYNLWVDGNLVGDNVAQALSFGAGTTTLSWSGWSRYFDGYIDEVGIWTRILNSTEVETLYNEGAGLAYPFTAPSEGAAEGENCSAKADCVSGLFCWGNAVGNYTCNNVAGNSVLPDLVYAPEADSCANCYTGTSYLPNNACVPQWGTSLQYCYQSGIYGDVCDANSPCINGKYCADDDTFQIPIIS